ncbi:phosphomannomutase CpsG [Endozoicomonas sp. OPT23]|uniref:phosphomannomutase CpsG n=1 Tax=Endozoicomonas sp. OPT23 TaxID=2072845 RepID=UPI00129B1CEE|nr:phosphomannomutase CpsG [Endozoicomonas sp. OPT23]MRI32074.1 phosphomannomutase CpsG [Endozoicomonas sp. OPT23]
MNQLQCFNSSDIRGKIPEQLNEDIAWRIGRATADWLKPETVIVGADCRLSSSAIKTAVTNGLRSAGVNVLDLGLCGTEEIYFAVSHLKACGGIMVTASHNPKDYNGMKLVGKDSVPIAASSGLNTIKELAENLVNQNRGDQSHETELTGSYQEISSLDAYIQHILGFINTDVLKPLKLVVNAGNGTAGHIVNAIEARLKKSNKSVEFIKLLNEPDGNFPHGVPNPLLPDARQQTIDAVINHKADMGIAWDGDFDRCFLFDEKGQFIEGYYIVGLLGEAFLGHHPAAKIIHDPRLTWNTIDQVKAAGGTPVLCRTGHSHIKTMMREENAVYGGEMSAHHYFRDFFYCDSGMIPWLLVAELISKKQKPLSTLVKERIALYPSSGEINSRLTSDTQKTIDKVRAVYEPDAKAVDTTDGISLDMGQWRFNLRRSNTEPVIRLNVESKNDVLLVNEKTSELLALIREH